MTRMSKSCSRDGEAARVRKTNAVACRNPSRVEITSLFTLRTTNQFPARSQNDVDDVADVPAAKVVDTPPFGVSMTNIVTLQDADDTDKPPPCP